jgi:hypothetical protein
VKREGTGLKPHRWALPAGLAASLALFSPWTSAQTGQQPRRFPLRATHYEVSAALTPKTHQITARARIDLTAGAASTRLAELELHPNLKVSAVLDAARRPVPYEREESNLIRVTLPDSVEPNGRTQLIVEYAGALAENETELPGGMRWAYVGEEGSYLLQPARWFPLTTFPGNRYTGVFEISVPGDVTVAGTGKSLAPEIAQAAAPPPMAPTPAPAKAPAKGAAKSKRAAAPAAPAEPSPPSPLAPIAPAGSTVYTFRVERPAAAGSFIIGGFQLVPVRAEGLSTSVFLPTTQADSARAYGETLASMVNYYSEEFGPLTDANLTVAQLPSVTGTPAGYSAPGVLFIPPRLWDAKANYRTLAQLAARQWWFNEVLPASPNDAWLGDGLARYSGALYVEKAAGLEGFTRDLEDAVINGMMYEEAAPISQAARLDPATAEYRSVVANKGAVVFHMLRGQLGDEAFRALLREYYGKFRGSTARLDDFQSLAMQKAAAARIMPVAAPASGSASGSSTAGAEPVRPGPNVQAFFGQWLHSTGVPEFKLEYLVIRTPKGFKVVGKIKQDLETFRSNVDVKVETDGNPETRTIEVVGADSPFVIETFGRPKPAGVHLDPNNQLLKASPRLRVRSTIARGEALAEEGKYFEAIQQYQKALEVQKNSSLAHFRMAEAFFFQKNLQAAANAFRDSIDGDRDPKWVEVWGYIYLGKIFDITGQRERAVNEYQKAVETNDDTGGAQAEAQKFLREPYQEKPVS